MSPTQTEREPAHRAYDDNEEDYAMPHRYATASGPDREISLGTGTILAIFFALALVCSVFFGLGYTTGRKSTPPPALASSEAPSRSASDSFKSFKPAPGGPAVSEDATSKPRIADPSEAPPEGSIVVPTSRLSSNPAVKPPEPTSKKTVDPDAEIVGEPASKPLAPHLPAPAAASIPLPSGTAIVQVAAVTHQEDADTIVATLKRKGYTVAVRHEPQDKFLHIQLGPYPSKKDAEAMRQRLQTDGFNPIVK